MDHFHGGNHINDVGLTGAIHYFASAGEILDPSDPVIILKNYLGMDHALSYS